MKVFLELLRLMNCFMAGAAAIIGLLLAGSWKTELAVSLLLVVVLITGAGNSVNDYFDRDIDAINRPTRPIPSGRISPRIVLAYSLVLFAAGCILAGLINQICLVIAALNSTLLYLYARNLKATPLLGNLSVSYLTGSTFLFGGAVSGFEGMISALIPASLSFMATMSREIVKDVEDMEGDRQEGAKTFPIIAGVCASVALASAFALAAVILSYLAPFGNAYIIIVTTANLFFLASVWKMAKGDATGSQRALKMGMAIALVAFLAAGLAQNAHL